MVDKTQKVLKLLDRLYNLRIENENVIIRGLNEQLFSNKEDIKGTSEEKTKNEIELEKTQTELEVFKSQMESFHSLFDDLGDDPFPALRAIGIDMDLAKYLEVLTNDGPKYNQELESKIEEIENNIKLAEEKIVTLNEENENLEMSISMAIDDCKRLDVLLEQSLSDESERAGLSIKYVKDILSKFQVFSDEEISSLAKLIMFPEDGLFDYDLNYDDRVANGFNVDENVSLEEKEEEKDIEENGLNNNQNKDIVAADVETAYKDIETPAEDLSIEAIINLDNDDTNPLEESLITLNHNDDQADEINDNENVESTNNSIEEVTLDATIDDENENSLERFLTELGLDLAKFEDSGLSTNKAYELLNDADPKLIEENYELLRSLNTNEDILYNSFDNYMFLCDNDLAKKITLLRAKGISETKIKELLELVNDCPFILSYETFENRVNILEKVTDENIYEIKNPVEKYTENNRILTSYGYEIDEKEIRNNKAVLTKSENIEENAEILKNYFISILRKNGKYALNVFWKTPRELLYGIDDIIEADLENIIETNPELLSLNCDQLIARTTYLNNEGATIFDDNSILNPLVGDYIKFDDTYHTNVNKFIPRNRRDVNNSLKDIINNDEYVESLVNILNEYYDKTVTFKEITLKEDAKSIYEELKSQIEEKLNAVATSKYNYKISDVSISKNKIERNISLLVDTLVSHGEPILGKEREILLVSILYNLRKDDETLSKIVNEAWPSNSNDNEVGGI